MYVSGIFDKKELYKFTFFSGAIKLRFFLQVVCKINHRTVNLLQEILMTYFHMNLVRVLFTYVLHASIMKIFM